ncbi:MAG: NAD(P)H-hydrate dehydratase, partial [Chloroflexi bacterium]|nr:NAD(P)H-hydrate dehydratase [Chloroflexota bacterium]
EGLKVKAVTADQMRAIEARCVQAGTSLDMLMENAGLAVAEAVAARLYGAAGKSVVVLLGPGNNGSDGYVAARHLSNNGANVTAFSLTKRPEPDEKRNLAEAAGVLVVEYPGLVALADACSRSDVVIDAVLGTGRARPINDDLARSLKAISVHAKDIVAVDLPTGINADTGKFDVNGLKADLTLMLGLPKIGLLTSAGSGVSGKLEVLDIGIPERLAGDVMTDALTGELAKNLLPQRSGDTNKGSFGRTLVLGGSANYLGAPQLAAKAALRSGVGLVFLASSEPVYRLIAGRIDEAIYIPLTAGNTGDWDVTPACSVLLSQASTMNSVLVGPGLGQSPAMVQLVEQLVRSLPEDVPAVLDADALNIVSRMHAWQDYLKPPAVITPHPGEMSRLLGCSVAEVQNDRLAAATTAASQFGVNVVLKGAATIIASPDGRVRISPWVNSGLAKAGTGDVLAGLLSGLLAQAPADPFDAASLAVYVHGLAGEIARKQLGERGMTAGDVASALPAAFLGLENDSG